MYKRQTEKGRQYLMNALKNDPLGMRAIDTVKQSDAKESVSYTHLDVYKRQVRNYRKELKRRRNKEISFCELPEIVVEKLAAVSYTHLDVYKRQVFPYSSFSGLVARARM